MELADWLSEPNEADDDTYNVKLQNRRLWPWSFPPVSPFHFTWEHLSGSRYLRVAPQHHLNQTHHNLPAICRHTFSLCRLLWRSVLLRRFLIFLVGVILLTPIFFPSYTHLPLHYRSLRRKALRTSEDGRGNPYQERIFIAVSLYDKDGHLAGGAWGQSVLDLIGLLGPENVFLSIYQSDSGHSAALEAMEKRVRCPHSIVNDLRVSKDDFPKITAPDGTQHVKRIMYLSEMRNRALRPLDQLHNVKFDKILFLNDISFEPVDAAQLLFSTNVGSDGRAQYVAACALDYINPFKFYDTFVTRDLEGYSVGAQFYPIFSNAGKAESRSDILGQKDAVRVKSCWSGMVAMQAQYIQSSITPMPEWFHETGAHVIDPESPRNVSIPVRFRAEPEIFLDACECCLFLADLLQVAKGSQRDDGIYVNPFIRVAYDTTTLSWLPIARRFERLFSWPHRLVNAIAGWPKFNPYRAVGEGEVFQEEIWLQDASLPGNGSWHLKQRTGRSGLYCALRGTQVLEKSPRTKDQNWFSIEVPPNRNPYFPT